MNEDWKQKARLQFAEKRQTGQLREIKVEEWGISVYFWPVMTLNERSAISRTYASDPIAALGDCLIARARDENGRNLFTPADRETIFDRYDPDVISRIAVEILNAVPEAASA